MPIELQCTPSIAPGFRLQWEDAQDGYVLLYPEGMVQLNQTAGEIMKRINGTSNTREIITQLEMAFQTQGIEGEVLAFLKQAHDKGWIRHTNG